MPNTEKKINDDRKSLLLSLLYLKAEARLAQMELTEKQIDEALNKALIDLDDDPALASEFSTMRNFINIALSTPHEKLTSAIQFLDQMQRKAN